MNKDRKRENEIVKKKSANYTFIQLHYSSQIDYLITRIQSNTVDNLQDFPEDKT